MTKDDLLAAGYKPFKQKHITQYTEQFYEKRFDDEKGKKYFILVAEYNNRQYKNNYPSMKDFSYAPESQFKAEGITFSVEMYSPESVEQMEAFFEKMWVSVGCDYYEEWVS